MTGYQIPFTALGDLYAEDIDKFTTITQSIIQSGIWMDGPHTKNFESWLAFKNNSSYATTCHSGTSALDIIAEYYYSQGKKTVLIPTFTYAATANSFIHAGWDVRLVDVTSMGLIDIHSDAINQVDAIVVVGLYGHETTTLIKSILSINPSITVIEDAAQNWLADQCTRSSVATAISFDPMKNLPAFGNGGAIITNDKNLNDFVVSYKNNGKPNFSHYGTNSRMSEIECASMMVKTIRVDDHQTRKRDIANYWMYEFKKANIITFLNEENLRTHGLHKFVISHNKRNQLKQFLSDKGIETKIHYEYPLHEVGYFKSYSDLSTSSTATRLSKSVLSLPYYPSLTDSQVGYIADQVLSYA